MIIEIKNYLDDEQVDFILNKIEKFKKENYQELQAGKFKTGYNRQGNTIFISGRLEFEDLDRYLLEVFMKIGKEIVIPRYKPEFGITDGGYEYHEYLPGDECHIHGDGEVDFYKDNEFGTIRFAALSLQLNDVEEGGELVFPNQGVKIKSEKGKLAVFPPYNSFPHYVSKCKTIRKVIVSWLSYDDIVVSRKLKPDSSG